MDVARQVGRRDKTCEEVKIIQLFGEGKFWSV